MTARSGSLSYRVEVDSTGLIWRRHLDHLHLRYPNEEAEDVMPKPSGISLDVSSTLWDTSSTPVTPEVDEPESA